MLTIRPSATRGYANHGWLESFHSFSFASYHDPAHMGFSVLRVINDDKVAPGTGFGMHGHQNMEIITYMLAGELRHEDSMGNGAVIRAGDVQRMTAGTGVRHSEMNASSQTSAHLLQIWIEPEVDGLAPGYEDKTIPLAEKLDQWRVIASHDGRADSLRVHQDITLYASVLSAGKQLPITVAADRSAYLHVASGQLTIGEQTLTAGDAVQVSADATLQLHASVDAEILWFDLPAVQRSH